MIAFAPVMFEGHHTSILIKLLLKYHIDEIAFALADKLLYFRPGASLLDTFMSNALRRISQFMPNTMWAVTETFTGFDAGRAYDTRRVPLLAHFDVAGVSCTSLKHFKQLVETGKFQSLARPGKPAVDYKTELIAHNLRYTDILQFVGSNDAFSNRVDVALLQ